MAEDIYRRFLEAPLRLKARKPSPSPPSTPPPSTQQYDTSRPNPWGNSPAFSTRSKEVKKLRRKVAKIKISAADAVIPRDLDDELRAVDASHSESDVEKNPKASELKGKQVTAGAKSLPKKKKRVTRSVSMKDEETGAEFVDTPTKALKPPKRVRKYSRDLGSDKKAKTNAKEKEKKNCDTFSFNLEGAESEDEKEKKDPGLEAKTVSELTPRRRSSVTVTLPLRRSRRLQHFKAESPKPPAPPVQPPKQEEESADAAMLSAEATNAASVAASPDSALETTQTSEAEMSVDLVSGYCESLLSTDTISGCFFALSLNALRDTQLVLSSKSESSESNPFESVFTICIGIAECERLAQRSFPPKTPKLTPSKSPKSPSAEVSRPMRRISLKDVKKAKNTKKSVRFRSFDLSCLNLQYVEDEQVAIMVDQILTRYDTVMEYVETMIMRFESELDTPAAQTLRELARMMASPSELYSGIPSDRADVVDTSKGVYRRAYGGRDLYSQHEIRVCGEYFARQFASLLVPRTPLSSTPHFLQSVFSSLASSTIRFKLRVLFIESEDFGENVNGEEVVQSRVLLDEDGTAFPAMAPYEHQDLGAAIHWALQESYLYWSLVQPLATMMQPTESVVSTSEDLDEESPLRKYLDESAAEDLDHMEKYVLARRFLRFHLTKSWRRRLKDTDAAETWAAIEKVCTLVKRFRFEDEAHLYPLASVGEFIATLTCEEPTLQRMEELLQTFYEQKHGACALYPEPCMECHNMITREENPTSIRCTSCARRFHLGCLHLPDSFAQFANHYTCPACFLGRGGC
ncbi:hypothetical protein PR003_g11246 [Phytophthora rubi]|uniref:Zinc finger PHD-type domain-containing protein n=1 Tax=Phytophthora rubi TaxID=129364 RepID=A0A6A4FBE6_9STRA|nr:hypothetical protein PR002_g12064 [Phytophthora rubi]KAE9031822.1 hypothetical protein PR001_g10897 [Phytophthora rubi]KAE9338985.1 hypothetical protein PR003_g11246 [Phytophthora rubi]